MFILPDLQTGGLWLNGGGGEDTFVLVGRGGVTAAPIGTIDGGGQDIDTLITVGQVDLTGLTITNVETFETQAGSPAIVTLTAAQLDTFTTITGNGVSELRVYDATLGSQNTVVDLTGKVVTGIASIVVGDGATVKLTAAQIDDFTLSQFDTIDSRGDLETGRIEVEGVITVSVALGLGSLLAPGFTISDSALAIEAIVDSAEQAILGKAATISAAESLYLSLSQASGLIGDGEASKIINPYMLLEELLTGAALTDPQSVAGLLDAQLAAVDAVRNDPVVLNATNGTDIPINDGAFTLLDTVANLLGAPGLVNLAQSYAVEDSGAALEAAYSPAGVVLLQNTLSVTAILGET